MIRKIGIRFGDNDFSTTFLAILTVMKERGLESYPSNKASLVALINKALPGVFWIAQNKGLDRENWDPSVYLKVTEADIFLNQEIKEFIDSNPYGFNYDFHVLDTTTYEPYIYSL